jgi:phosphatidylinositol alpha-mannosyltransferase
MKIGIVTENYFPTLGGVQEHVYELSRSLRAMGYDVRIITGLPKVDRWRGPPDDESVLRVGRALQYGTIGTFTRMTFGPRIAWRLRQILKEERFDLLHLHSPCVFGLPLLAYALYQGPKIATLHSAFKPGLGRELASPYYRWIISNSAAVIAVSAVAGEALRRYASFDYEIVPNGVDVRRFGQGKPRFRRGGKTLLYLGRLEDRNGLDLLLRALPAIVRDEPQTHLLVAGDGPNRAAYEALVTESLRPHVSFLGAVYEERYDLYASCDQFIVPARGGTFSIMVLEALAAGVPVVSTPFIPPEQRQEHWSPLAIAAEVSPEALAATVVSTLREDPRERVGAGRRVVEQFDWSVVAPRIADVYTRALSKRSASA